MDDEFRIIFSEKCPYARTSGATSLHALFAKDIKELGSSDSDWYLDGKVNDISNDEDNCSENPADFSNHSNSTTDGISASVKNLLNLLVKRAARCQDEQRVLDDEDLNSSVENSEMLLADESWTSSMATPTKNNASTIQIINSDINNLTHENCVLENSISTKENAENVDWISTVEGEFDCQELNCDFFGFDVPANLIRKDDSSSERLDVSMCINEDFCSHYVKIMSKISQSSTVDTLMLLSFTAPSLEKLTSSDNRNIARESFPPSDSVEGQFPSCSHHGHVEESLHGGFLCQTSKSLHCSAPSVTDFHSNNNKSDRIDTTISDLSQEMHEYARGDLFNSSISEEKEFPLSQGINLSCVENATFTVGGNCSHVTNSHVVSATHDDVVGNVLENCVDEPKHVAEILNLLCSPVKKSETSILQRKRNMSGDDSAHNKRSCFENESKLVVKELVMELLNEIELQLFPVKSVFLETVIGPSDVNSLGDRNENMRECSQSCKDKLNDKEKIFDGLVDPQQVCTNTCISDNLCNTCEQNSNQEALSSYSSMQSAVSGHQSELVIESDNLNRINSDALCNASAKRSMNHTLSPEVNEATISGLCCESTTTETFLSSTKGDAKSQMEPEVENDSYLNCCGTEDFLSCSVLEEICQASEALAYDVKMKTDCVISDCHSEIEGAGDCCKKADLDSSLLDGMDRFKCKREDDVEGIKNCLRSDNSYDNCDSKNNNCKLLSETKIAKIDEDTEQSIKRKILFSAPSEETNNEAIHVKTSLGNKTDNYGEYLAIDSSLHSSKIPQCLSKTNHPHTGSEMNSSLQKNVNQNTFVYPKQVRKIYHPVSEKVCLKDIIISAVELERHSRCERNGLQPAPIHLKANSLVSFSNLENSLLGKLILPERNDKTLEVQRPLERDSPLLGENVPKPTSCVEYGSVASEHHALVTSSCKNVCSENKNMTFKVVVDDPDATTEKTHASSSKEELVKLDEVNLWKCEDIESEILITDGNATGTIDRSASPVIRRRLKGKRKVKRENGTKFITAATPTMKSTSRDSLNNITTRQYECGERSAQNKSIYKNCKNVVNNKLCNKDLIITTNEENHASNQGNEDIPPECISTSDLGGPVGFTSASGKKVNVSMKSMLRAKSLFADESTPIRGESVGTPIGVSKTGESSWHASNQVNEDIPPECIWTSESGGPVGFTSASGKKVNVSMKSMLRAKSLFADESTPIRGESVGTPIGVSKTGESSWHASNQVNEDIPPECIWTSESGGPVGFTSASGKKVNVSMKSMLRAKSLFADESTPIRGESVGTPIGVSKTGESSWHASNQVNEDIPPECIWTSESGGPVGFTSASGKKVNVSMKSMLRAKSLFADESTPIRGESVGTPIGVSKTGESSWHASNQVNEDIPPECIWTSESGGPVGFTSASGKKVNVSMKSMLRAKSLFADESTPIRGESVGTPIGVSKTGESSGHASNQVNEDIPPECIWTSESGGPVGFTSASGKKVNVSMKSMLRAKSLFADESTPIRGGSVGTPIGIYKTGESSGHASNQVNEDIPPECISTSESGGPVGFTSASGKKVNVSMKSMLRAKSLFADESTPIRGGSVGTPIGVYKTGESSGHASNQVNEDIPPECIWTSESGGPVGFTSASGKKVNVSMKSMLRAKSLFADESTPIRGGSVGTPIGVYKTGESSGHASNQVNEDIPPECISTSESGGPVGFTSASGKKVNVSMKSMLRAKSLFADESTPIRGGSVGTPIGVYKTGESSGHASNQVNEDIPPECIWTSESGGPVGFTSASGKKVNVSMKSMLRAKSLFADESTPIRGGSVGTPIGVYKTGESSGHASNQVNEDIPPECISTSESGGPVGFTSASGKKVNVSMKSMLRAKSLFADESTPIRGGSVGTPIGVYKTGESSGHASNQVNEDIPPECISTSESGGPVGFTSASGKKVNVSMKSMLRAKSLFADESTPIRGGSVGTPIGVYKTGESSGHASNQVNEDIPPECISTSESGGPVGFTFASGKKVNVSMKSMLRAKSLFADESTPIRGGSVGTPIGVYKTGESSGHASNQVNEDIPPECISTSESGGPVGFTSASGKKVNVSMKSMLRAKSLFADESTPIRGGSVGTPISVYKTGESSGHASNQVNEDIPPECISTSESGGPVGFTSASGKKVNVSMKSMLRAKSLFADESTPIRGGSVGTPFCFSKTGKSSEYILNEGDTETEIFDTLFPPSISVFKIQGEQISSSEPIATKSEILLSLEAVVGSSVVRVKESSMSCNSCLELHPVSNVSSPLRLENISDSTDPRQDTGNEQIVKCPQFSKDISVGHQSFSSSVERNDVMDVLSPAVKNKKLKCGGKNNVPTDGHISSGKEQVYKSNQEVFQCESQGDDFIMAVDAAVLNSVFESDIEYPPSPVFKTSNRKRTRTRKTTFKSKLPKKKANEKSSLPKLNSEVADSPTSEPPDIDCDLSNSLMASLPLTGECEFQELSEPMDMEIGEEALLGTHVEFSKADLGRIDPWMEERKKQADTITSKKFIKPVFGSYHNIRTGKQLRRSLREIVRGKKPGRYSKDQLRKFGVLEDTCSITSSSASVFKFKLPNYYVETRNGGVVCVGDGFRLIPDSEGMFGSEEAETALLAGPGVDPSLLPPGGWCLNHYRWIVWKLASLEKSFPQEFAGKCLTPENVMCQLKYRWDREIDSGERPALRRIFEKDDIASKRMILCISGMKQSNAPESSKQLELGLAAYSSTLELTDGWYSITGVIDSEMDALIRKGKLTIGTKIVTSGGELTNSPLNGCHPLEPSASLVKLLLHTNSTRRACWDAKLGFMCKHPGPLPVALNSLLPHGGAVNALKNVMVARTYPVVYVERTPGDRKVVRSSRAEARAASVYEHERQVWLESVYSEVSSEMQKEAEERRQKRSSQSTAMGAGNRSRSSSAGGLRQWKRGVSSTQSDHLNAEELCSLCEEAGDPTEVLLTSSQMSLVNAYRQESRDTYNKELEDRVRRKLKEEEDRIICSNSKGPLKLDTKKIIGRVIRNVVPLLKVRLVDVYQPVHSKAAILTIWQPSEEVLNLFSKEGIILDIYNLTAAGVRSNYLQLNSGKQTRYTMRETHQSATLLVENHPWLKRRILSRGFDDLMKPYSGPSSSLSVLPFGEIDLVATVIRIGKKPDKEKGFQHVYLAGSDGSLVGIAFWGGVQEFAINEFLCPKLVVVATNLQLRPYHGLHRLPTVQATELSTFTLHPTEDRLKIALKNFFCEMEAEEQLKANGADFIALCEQKLDTLTVSQEDGVKKLSIGDPSKQLNPPSLRISCTDSGYSMSPVVCEKIKKLQKCAGAPEYALPVHHLGKSAGVKKAFQPPQRSPD